jgi:hypothetical protein
MKDNDYLHFAVMTGIMRVAKEGLFSGLNNLKVDTILNKNYEDYFGLSENDVDEALKEYKLKDNIDEVKEWYNGYLFGNKEIYNPWSIINYLDERELGAYWINTSDNHLIKKVLKDSNNEVYNDLMNLLNGEKVTKNIDAEMVFGDLKGQDSLWTLLLFSGYLTIVEKIQIGEYTLKIPNREIFSFFKKSFIDEFTGKSSHYLNKLLDSLRESNIMDENSSFEEILKKIFLSHISYHDGTNKENFYHAFMLGITVGFEMEYRTHSNLESGKGRPDLILKPINKSKTGYIFEFKVSDSEENLDKKLDEAIKQITDKKYKTLLSEDGIKDILGIAIAFCGKELKVKYEVL